MFSRCWEGGLEQAFLYQQSKECQNSGENTRTQDRSTEIRVIFASRFNNNQNEIRGSHWCEIEVTFSWDVTLRKSIDRNYGFGATDSSIKMRGNNFLPKFVLEYTASYSAVKRS